MVTLETDLPILVACTPVDMRKSIDGLCVAVTEQLSRNPQVAQIFLFHNKNGDKVKLLYWDRNGFCLLYKRLEKRRFQFPKVIANEGIEIDGVQLRWLLAGFEFSRMADFPELNFAGYC